MPKATVAKSDPGSSDVHVDAPLGSRKYPNQVKKENVNPPLNNLDVTLAESAANLETKGQWAGDSEDTEAYQWDEGVAKTALSSERRKNLSDKSFALPSSRRYPIHDISHARNALARSSGKPEEAEVRQKVYAKYPELNKDKVSKQANPRRVSTVAVKSGSHLLMGKRRDNGLWTTPGGHLNPGENFRAGAARELEEETGLKLDEGNLLPLSEVHELVDQQGAPLHVQPFEALLSNKPGTSMQGDPDGEVHRWHWVDISSGIPDEMKDQMHTPLERNVLMQALGLAPMPEPEQEETEDDESEQDDALENGLRLDLGSGQAREADHIGVDLYPFDEATLVHDLSLGLPFDDASASAIRLVNALEDMEDLRDDPSQLIADIARVLMPGGLFHYQGVAPLEAPDSLEEVEHSEGVAKEGEAGWHQQTFEKVDPATADDAETPRGGLFDAGVSLALDAFRDKDGVLYPPVDTLVGKSKTLVAKIGLLNRKKQIVYCVVLSPEESDQQEDFMLAEDIEIAAHRYLLNSRIIGAMHTKIIKAAPVESYIAPMDMAWENGPYGPQKVKKGAWVIAIKIFDPTEWAKVEDGEYQSVSVSGLGIRDDMKALPSAK